LGFGRGGGDSGDFFPFDVWALDDSDTGKN
jgi:hypothetical protein